MLRFINIHEPEQLKYVIQKNSLFISNSLDKVVYFFNNHYIFLLLKFI